MHATQPLRVRQSVLETAPATPSSFPFVLLLAAVGLGVVLLILVGLALTTPSAPESSTPQQLPVVAAAEPVCRSLDEGLSTVSQLLATGRLEAASDLAIHHLNDEGLCPEARQAAAALGYSAQAQALLAQPSTDSGVEARERWLALEVWADAQEVPASRRMSPSVIFTQAYGLGAWALSREAFLRLWEAGAIGPSDSQQLVTYISLLRNWGNALHMRAPETDGARAEQMLATAQAIADALRLPMGEACADLESWGVDHCRRVPPDYNDPVLADLLPSKE